MGGEWGEGTTGMGRVGAGIGCGIPLTGTEVRNLAGVGGGIQAPEIARVAPGALKSLPPCPPLPCHVNAVGFANAMPCYSFPMQCSRFEGLIAAARPATLRLQSSGAFGALLCWAREEFVFSLPHRNPTSGV